MNRRIIFILILGTLVFSPVVQAQESNFNLNLDPQSGLNQLQTPFSNFFEDASNIDISQSSSTQLILPDVGQAQTYWDNANAWLKEKTGLDILNLLKVIGNILVFIMNLAINAMGVAIKVIQWLLSLIPTNTQ